VSDSEKFGARIVKIEVAVAKIWQKEFWDLFVISGKWVGVYLKIFSKIRGLLGIFGIVA
jgi:hypothetical protein